MSPVDKCKGGEGNGHIWVNTCHTVKRKTKELFRTTGGRRPQRRPPHDIKDRHPPSPTPALVSQASVPRAHPGCDRRASRSGRHVSQKDHSVHQCGAKQNQTNKYNDKCWLIFDFPLFRRIRSWSVLVFVRPLSHEMVTFVLKQDTQLGFLRALAVFACRRRRSW